MNLAVDNCSRSNVTIQRVEESRILEGYSQRHVGFDVLWCQVGNEVVIARWILPADGLQTILCLHRLGRGCLSQLLGIYIIEYLCSLCLQCGNMGLDGLRHVAAARDNQSAIARTGCCLEHTVFVGNPHQQAFGDVVAIKAGTVDVEDGLDEFGSQFAHAVDGELHEQLLRIFLPHVAYRQECEEVVVGLSPLQETLTALYIFHKVGGIAPDGVRGTHVYRGIELPAWPRIVLGRIASAVEEHVVDAGAEHQVKVGLQL